MTEYDYLAVLGEHWFHDGGNTCECGYWAELDSVKRHHIEDALRAHLSDLLNSVEAVEAVAEAIHDQQMHSRVEYKRRVGYHGRISLARTALDAACEQIGVPTSIDRLVTSPGGSSNE